MVKYPFKGVPGAEELTSGEIRTLLNLMHIVGANGRATVRSVAAAEGKSIQTTHGRLKSLTAKGWVTHDVGRTSTYWPAVKAKAAGTP